MLARLSIRDVVLIRRLDLNFEAGLTALTGETGAGKSILLDALGLVLGARAERALVRAGAENAQVTALFELPDDHAAWPLVEEAGVGASFEDGPLILRRRLAADGRSRAWVNDEPVSVGLLAQLGEVLSEVHGQHDDRGLLNAKAHRRLLDAFGDLGDERAACAEAWAAREAARNAFEDARAEVAKAGEDADWLTHAVDELEKLAPKTGEEAALDAERKLVMGAEGLAGEIRAAQDALAGDGAGGSDALARALRGLEGALAKLPEAGGGALQTAHGAAAALERALNEADEAARLLDEAAADLDFDPGRGEAVEERLFALRDAARKHRVEVDDLPALRDRLRARLDGLDRADDDLRALEAAAEEAAAAYDLLAESLSTARVRAAGNLDSAVAGELAPLKLDKARFETRVGVGEGAAGPEGRDAVEFTIATNPGARPGPLVKIASGGELARFILALKVCLARNASARTLVFDEVDRGVGGAVASAVGERLARLAEDAQVLVVTHSPQVAARAARQWRIAKSGEDDVVTSVDMLDEGERTEEVARMLAGETVTEEARAAARRLIADAAS